MPDIELWDALYGNRALKALLAEDIAGNKLSHAYIFEGPENSGKKTLARIVAAAMAEHESDVRKILSGISPDVIEIDLPEKRKTIGVDTVREMKLASCLRPNDLDYKVFIVDHAEALTLSAQNALLKLIEEPPAGVYLLLLTKALSALLPTIRSRAPVLRMQAFSAEELTKLLLEHSTEASRFFERDRETFAAIVRSSGGAYGEAMARIAAANDKKNDPNDAVLGLLEALCERDRVLLSARIWALPPEREAFRQTTLLLLSAVRDIMAYRLTGGDCDYLFPRGEKTPAFAARLSIDRLLKISDAVTALEKDALYNPNVQGAKALLFTKLSGV